MAAKTVCVVLTTVLSFVAVSGQKINVLCMLEHCAVQMTACMLDASCRDAVLCIKPCGSNQTCAFMCLSSYADSKFDAFMKCGVTDNPCVELTPPVNPVHCKKPNNVKVNFTLNDLQGKWYIVKGLNPVYDCFNCQISTYTVGPKLLQARVREQYDAVTIDGSVKHLVTEEAVVQLNPSNGGILRYNSSQDGLLHQEEFRVLDFSADDGFVLMYYCGGTGPWVYEGVILYSKTSILTTEAIRKVTLSASTFGFNLTTFCSPRTTGCVEL